MSDMDRITEHITGLWQQPGTDGIISDACARVISSLYHNGQASLGYAFASTGAIPPNQLAIWDELFPNLWQLSSQERIHAMHLYTYLRAQKPRGPVNGWAALWLN